MRGDPVRACVFGQFGRAHRIRHSAAARISHSCNMIDINAQAQFL
jgi:hypothetical protein